METLFYLFIFLFLVYVLTVIYFYFTQDKKIFNRIWAVPVEVKNVKKVFFKTSQGCVLEGGYLKNVKNGKLVLYFGGNANNVFEFLDNIAPNLKRYNFISFNYPGYSNSECTPSEEGILKAAVEIYDKYKPDIIMGRSLGSAVAAYTAFKKNPEGVLLVTPFDSIAEIAKDKYPFLPVGILLKHKFEEYKWIGKYKGKVNVLLVEKDDIIPEKSIEKLLKSIPDLQKTVKINTSHSDVYKHKEIFKILDNLLNF